MKIQFYFACCGLILLFNLNLEAQMKREVKFLQGRVQYTRATSPGTANRATACTADTIILTTQAQIDNFSSNYPSCTTPKYLFIDGTGASPAISNLTGLNSLTQVINKFVISHTSVTSLSALSNLTFVGDTLQVEYNPLLTEIGLNNLVELGGIVLIDLPVLTSVDGLSNHINRIGCITIDSTALTSLTGFSGIDSIMTPNGGLRITHTPVPDLSSLTDLSVLNGYIILDDISSMTTIGLNNLTAAWGFLFANMPNLTSIAGLSYQLVNKDIGTFWMINTGLTDLSGLDSITSSSNFYLWGNPSLSSLHGLEHLNGNIGGGISLWNNGNLSDITALQNISSLSDGTLEIHSCNALTNLNGLGNIVTIGRGLWINDNNGLTTLSDLNLALDIQNAGNTDSVRINDNSQLAACAFQPLCNYLSVGGTAEIANNAPGCSSASEIINICSNNCSAGSEKTWNGSNSGDWFDPNNWTPLGVPGTCTKVIIPAIWDVPNYPEVSADITIGGLVMVSDAILQLDFHDLYITKTLQLDAAYIHNAANITATKVFEPTLNSSHLEGNFTCTDFGGLSQFTNNTFDGNTVLSDSIGRLQNSSTFFNTFNGDLSFINNSDYGNNYLGNASPGHDYVAGNLTVTNNSTASISVGLGGNNAVQLNGSFTTNSNSGNIDIQNLTFTGTNQVHLTQAGSVQVIIDNLWMQKNGGGSLILDQDIHITNTLNFTEQNNIIYTAADKLLILNNASSANTVSGSYVIGPVKKIGTDPFTFPVGTYENNAFWYAPVSISAPASATDEFTAQYFHHNPANEGYDTSLHIPGLNGISTKEYWQLTRNNGSSDVNVTLSYDSARSGAAYLYNALQTAGWNGSQWRSWGNGGYAGNIAAGTVQSAIPLTEYGPVTLAFKPVRKPVITIGTVDSIPCAGNYFSVPFSLDTAMITANIFRVEISDSLGNFNSGHNDILGIKSSISSDTIQAYMPFTLAFGRHYKIRVLGSLPPDTSINDRIVIPSITPQLAFNIIGNTPACIGNGLQYYYPSIHEANTTYTWTLSGGGSLTTSGDTAIINWLTAGTYSLTLKSSNHCGNGPQKILSVDVRPPAPADTAIINNNGRWIFGSQAPVNAGYQWYRNGISISGAVNASYYASLSGNYTLKFANYCGSGPVSNTISFAAASTPQTISFTAITDKTFGDPAFVPVATASSGLPVSFIAVSGPATINPQTNLLTITGTGLVTVSALQRGDDVYDTAATVTRTFTVNKAAQVITFTAIPDQHYSTQPLILAATSTSGLPVSYTIVSGPATVSGIQLTLTGLGTVSVSATQTGDTNYLPATAVSRTFCTNVSFLDPIAGYNNLCPATATYSVNAISGAAYFWRIAGSGTLPSTTNTTNVNWTTPGTYSLLVSASGSCGAASSNDTLIINVLNSVEPDSVQSMFPANGAINQQLPLTLSWIPARPDLYYTFDLYIWRADTAQPALPYAAGLSAVNYTLPVNNGLAYNQTYKWMVVAHNGSCTLINSGPVQQFSLIPLPDLVMQQVLAPATAFSGQQISLSWTVKNTGPGKTTTNQHWTDGIFLTFDTLPDFSIAPQTNPELWGQSDYPSRPLLVASRSNVSALDSGQQYSNSVNFTLPLSYSLPLYAYAITNYPNNAAAPVQITRANDSARASQAIAVTLSPTPDLRVDTVFAPATTFSGSIINVTYKVKNYGVVTPTGSAWTDKLYFSQSPLFNINTAIPLKLPKANGTYYTNAPEALVAVNGQLLADSFYTRSVQVVVPNFISGTWFVFVVSNVTGTLYEGALNNNNLNSYQQQVFLTPTPHLTVSSLSVPVTTASTTQPIGVSWIISNTGFNDNIEKNKGHYFVPNGSCTLPNTGGTGIGIRDSISYGSSYWVDRVYLSTDSTGLNTANAVQVNETYQGIFGSGINVENIPLPPLCQPSGTNPAELNLNTLNVIKPGSGHPKTAGFTIPSGLPSGNYYVYVLANAAHSVYEYPGTPETRRSALPINIQRPDVVVSALTAPATATGDQSFVINYSVLNNGPGTVYSHPRKDMIYVSTAAVFNASAQLIDSLIVTESLPAGTAMPHTLNYTFPASTSGTRYLYVYTNADSGFRETNSGNNISAGLPISVTAANPADLVVSAIQIADTVFSIFPAIIKYTVTNNGSGTVSGNRTDSIYISCSASYTPATRYFIAKRNHSELLISGSSYTDSFAVNMPFAFDINPCFPKSDFNLAYFHIKTNADSLIYEGSNGNNNVTGSGSRVILNPSVDHIVTSVTGPDTATVARPYLAGWTVKNIGYNPGSGEYFGWYDGIFFSPDSVFNSNAVQSNGFFEATPLNTNQTYSDSKNAIPPVIPTGDYYVFARTNYSPSYGIRSEVALVNNDNLIRNSNGSAKKIHVIQPLLPDLRDSIISSTALVALGQPVTIISRVTNAGAGITYPGNWSDDSWLSTDFIPGNGGDIVLSGKNHSGALLPGQFYMDTVTATIPLNTPPGNYALISRTNSSGNVLESNNTNNSGFRYITVYSPAPSDLIVNDISKPDTVLLGYNTDTIRWVIQNISANAASGVSSDGVYLSKNITLDSTAVLLGIKNKTISMGPLAKDTIRLAPLVNNVTEGNYNVIVKTDLLNNIVESNKNNNTGVAVTQLYVSVKELPLNILTANTLFSNSRFYKLVIPDSLNGTTLLLTLKSADSLTMKNQLYVGNGYIPSAAHFDYAYNTPNYGNQDIVMASVSAGVYYITVNCVSANPVVQNITLKAVKLPFSILNVQSSSGGNSGNVTIKISGSLFVSNMTATLSKAGTLITASAVYFSNSTTVYATFNLQGRPLGIYDVTLTKPDAATTTLPASFSVVTPNNGGLITGGGVNTGPGNGNSPGCDPGAASGLNSQLVTEIVAPDKVLVGWPFVIQINYNNPTNVDIPAQTRTLYSDHNVLLSFTPAGVATGTTSLYLELTEQNGPPGIIRAGGSGSIIIYSRMHPSLPRNTTVLFSLK